MNTMKTLVTVVVAILAVMAVVGCSSLAERASNQDFTLKFLTQYATLKYVQNESGGIDQAAAVRVHDHAVAVKGYLDASESVLVDDLEQFIIDRVDWADLSVADARGARALIAFLSQELRERADALDTTSDSIRDGKVVAYYLIEIVTDTLRPYQT